MDRSPFINFVDQDYVTGDAELDTGTQNIGRTQKTQKKTVYKPWRSHTHTYAHRALGTHP